MAITNAATLVVGAGNYFTAPYVQATPASLPADLSAVSAPWVNVGHTSLEDVFSMTSEGGEPTVLGTLQNKSLRTSYSARQETINFTLQQFDEEGLKLYYGANATAGASGEIQGPSNPTPTVCSFLAVFTDGANQFAFYAPKAEIFRADDLSISDTESLAGLPLAVKPLNHATNQWAYAVTPLA
jgi:hypothetical protein